MRFNARAALGRRNLILGAGGLLAAPALVTWARAQAPAYPTRPLRLIVPFPPAGAADVLGRVLAEAARPLLGQTVVVENRAGGGGSIGTEATTRAAADGYTILLGNQSTNAINPEIKRLTYNPATALVPLAAVGNVSNVLYARKGLPVSNLAGLVALAKARPGALTYGTAGIGSSTHLAMLLLESQAGIELTHVPYQGTSPATAAVLAGQIDMMFDTVPTAIPHIDGGSVTPIAVTSRGRHARLPQVPSFAESGYPDYEAVLFYVLFAPVGLPAPILVRLGDVLEATVALPAVRAKLAEIGADPLPVRRQDLAGHIAADRARWAEVIRRAGLTIE
ncbi:tripartite tricarboxylate transporter substrate binding protein [Roseococcus sp. SYP-B2431]|uniref:Bug family tripartite tricarboxylate transporter substrate binding protein n=1 Tax=Roseococcus sp. SYP-B2431 TaxID=2496640 RepID=UPI0010409678|nr:tripartite tricarboxylate transporter substrate binding protein [Roseococcus sp. SYP-B2431]TCH98773.1 tripartite tricarboxylate transporter substrate binding protein [Roseococcus sp. SYP-B2431]